ncbi:MAG: BatD family protein [Prevotellaceae bacterium]|jgi:hypothetical protein|nr:BatD family protein [Prevotellaceae bacterium]
MNICKKFLGFILTVCLAISAIAKDLEIEADAIVSLNSEFKIAYKMEYEQNNPVEDFSPPTFADNFNVIAGPTRSMSMLNNNGKVTLSVTFTYYVQALREGVFDLPQASVKMKDGKVVKSKQRSIEILKEEGKNAGGQQNVATDDVSPEDLFVKMDFNRQSVYKGEPMVLTVKLYNRGVAVADVSNFKMPTLAGFDMQELKITDAEWKQQKYNNKIYQTYPLARLILYPLRAGELKLDPVELVTTIQVRQQQTRANSMFDVFIGSPVRNIRKSLKSAPVTLNIKDFPAGAPASFNGATGDFKLSSKIDKTTSVANQPVTFSITVSGTGNFKQIKEPLIALPDNFDKYDPKIIDNVKSDLSGGAGSKKFEYVFIPRNAGEFDIPAVEFSYFDVQKNSYVSLKTEPVHLIIERDPNGSNAAPVTSIPIVTGKQIKHLGNDILFIKTDMPKFAAIGQVFFGSFDFWLIFAAFVLAFAVAVALTKKSRKNRQNVALMRNRKANKVAVLRLQQSAKFLKTNNLTAFYEEVSRAVWGYIGDKLNMQSAELSRDNIQDKLNAQNVPQENIDLLIAVIDNCEYARYAPGGSREGMEEMYRQALQAISKLENLK